MAGQQLTGHWCASRVAVGYGRAVSGQPWSQVPATGVLFDRLVDDAAVFPPGSAALVDALANHRCFRESPASRYVGPLLVPASAATALLELVGDPAEPLSVAVIGAGGDPAGVVAATRHLCSRAGLTVVGVEIPLAGTSVDSLLDELRPVTDRHIPIALEVRRHSVDDVLAVLQHPRLLAGDLVRAKYRTGGIGGETTPGVTELSTFIAAIAGAELPAKFTAGLHHAVTAGDQYGVLNLMVGVRRAVAARGPTGSRSNAREVRSELADPALVEAIAVELRCTDPERLSAEVGSWTEHEIYPVRRIFRSFGCCGVLEPLTELAGLGLIPPMARDLTAPDGQR